MKNTKMMANIAMIAALYAAVSLVLAPLSFGNIQCRVSEALTLLPLIYAPAVPGVILGCFLTNLIGTLSGTDIIGIVDCVVGTCATAIAAYLTYRYRNVKIKGIPWLGALMPVVVNGVLIGIELGFVLYPGNVLVGSLISGIEVAAGECIAVVLGLFLVKALEKTKIFQKQNEL